MNPQNIENFLEFEKKSRINKISYNSQPIWPLIRHSIYTYLHNPELRNAVELDYKKNKRTSSKRNILALLKSFKTFSGIFKKTDIVIFSGEKVLSMGKVNCNPLLWDFYNSLKNNYDITVIDPYGVKHPKEIHKKTIDVSQVLSLGRYLSSYFQSKLWFKCSEKLDRKIIRYSSEKIPWTRIYSNTYINHKLLSFITKCIILIKAPLFIIFSDSGSFSSVIKTAKKYNVITIDYQHAQQSGQNILYRHDNSLKQRTFLVDYIFSFGEYWNKYFIKTSKVKTVGNYVFEYLSGFHKDVQKNKKSVMIISDNNYCRNELVELAMNIVKRLKDYKVYYKLRPEEYQSWESSYPIDMVNSVNIKFIDNENKGLYYYLKKSNYVIGMNSTVLIEAIPFTNVIVYEVGWFFEMMEFINSGYILSSANRNKIIEIIEKNLVASNTIDKNKLFRKNTKENILNTINQLAK